MRGWTARLERKTRAGCAWLMGACVMWVMWVMWGGEAHAQGKAAEAVAVQGSAGGGEEELKRAEGLYRKGIELYSAQKFGEAEAAFSEAWAIRKTYDIAANLGHTEAKLGKFDRAALHLSFALKNWPFAGKPEPKELAKKRFEEVRGKVGSLVIEVNPAGAEVYVGGEFLGVAPLADEVFGMPGEAAVEARMAGYAPMVKKVLLSAGGTEKVGMELVLLKPVKPKDELPLPKDEDVKRSRVPVYVGAGLSAVALGFGIGFTVAANDAIDEASAQREKILGAAAPKTPCDCLNGEEGDKLRGILSHHDSMSVLAISSYVLSGGAAIFSVVYGLWPTQKPSVKKQVSGALVPVISKHDQGLMLRGEF